MNISNNSLTEKIREIIILLSCCIYLSAFLTGCPLKNRLLMNMTLSEKVVVDYFKEKYSVDAKINDSKEYYYGGDIYAEIRVAVPNDDDEYLAVVKPIGDMFDDADTDEYFDKYEVFSDNYMCRFVEPVVKDEMDCLINDIGIDDFNSFVNAVHQHGVGRGEGFLTDFPLMTSEQFADKGIIKQCDLSFDYFLRIPESMYNENLETSINEVVKSGFINSHVYCNIQVYHDEDYKRINNHTASPNQFRELKNLRIYVN